MEGINKMGIVDFSSYTYDDDEEKKKKPSQEAREQLDFQRKEKTTGLVDFSSYSYKEPQKEPTKTFQVDQPEEEKEDKGLFQKGLDVAQKGAKAVRKFLFGRTEEEQTVEEMTGLSEEQYANVVGVVERKKQQAQERLKEIQTTQDYTSLIDEDVRFGEEELTEQQKKELVQTERPLRIGPFMFGKEEYKTREEAEKTKVQDPKYRKETEIRALKDTIKAYDDFLTLEPARRGFLQQLWSEIKNPVEMIVNPNRFERTQVTQKMEIALNKYKDLNENEEELTEEEQSFVNRWRADQINKYMDSGIGSQAAEVVANMPYYMMEIAVTSQMAGPEKDYTQIADNGLKVIGVTSPVAKKWAEKFLSNTVRMAVASRVNFPAIDEKTASYMLDIAELDLEKEGDGVLEIVDEGFDRDAAVSKAYASVMTEYISEGVGDYVDDAGIFVKKAFINKWLKNKGLLDASEGTIRKALKKVHFNGLLSEVLEEEFAEPIQSIIDEREYNDPFFTPEGRERLLVETLGIGAFSGMASVADTTSQKISKRRQKNPKDKIMVRTAKDVDLETQEEIPTTEIQKDKFIDTIGVEEESRANELWQDYTDFAYRSLSEGQVKTEPEAFENWFNQKLESGEIVPDNLPDVVKKEFETEKFERQEEITRDDILEEYPDFNKVLGFEGDVAENLREEFIQFTLDNKNIPLDEAFEAWERQSEALAKAEATEYEATDTGLLDRIKGEIASGNLEQAQRLYDQSEFEQTFDEITEETENEMKAVYEDVEEQIPEEIEELPQDHPDRAVIEIADRIGKHFKAPGALYKVVGAKRTYRTPDGTELLIEGDTYSFFDRWVFANDIEGFKDGLKVLSHKFNKTFTELYNRIQKGAIDNADFKKFEQRLEKHLKERPAYARRSREVAEERATREEREGEEPGEQVTKPVSGEQRAEEGREKADLGEVLDVSKQIDQAFAAHKQTGIREGNIFLPTNRQVGFSNYWNRINKIKQDNPQEYEYIRKTTLVDALNVENYEQIPDTIPVYRGGKQGDTLGTKVITQKGIPEAVVENFTLDKDVAEQFAGEDGQVITRYISKEDVPPISQDYKAEKEIIVPLENVLEETVEKKLPEGLAKWKSKIISKMKEMNIKDFSDKELERVFEGTVGKNRLIENTKLLEKEYGFSIGDVFGEKKEQPVLETQEIEAEEPEPEQTTFGEGKPSQAERQRMFEKQARKKRVGTRKGFEGTPFGEQAERETLREQMGDGLFAEDTEIKEGESNYYAEIRESLATGEIPDVDTLRDSFTQSPVRVKYKENGFIKFPNEEISSPADVAWAFKDLRNNAVESFYMLGMKGNTPVTVELISIGVLDKGIADPYEVSNLLLTKKLDGAYLIHNHPSGDPRPSTADKNITRRMRDALERIGVELKGHVIINSNEFGVIDPIEHPTSFYGEKKPYPRFAKPKAELPVYQKYVEWLAGEENKPKAPKLNTSRQVADFAKKIQTDWDNQSLIIYLNSRNVAQGVDVVNKNDIAIKDIVKSAGNMRGKSVLIVNKDFNIGEFRQLQNELHELGIDLLDSLEMTEDGFRSRKSNMLAEGEAEYSVEKVGLRADLGDKGGYETIEDFKKEVGLIQSVEFPELYQIAKRLGADTELNSRLRSSLGRAVLGEGFVTTPTLELRPDIFEDPMIARRVIAHEIGHLTDYLPEGTLGRGRLVGRIASLQKYLKQEYKDLKDPKLREELKTITQLWKPFDETANENYTKYRYSSRELYADAISVLFNKPELLKQKAPKFWDSFFEYMDRKPEVKREYFATWTTLNSGAAAVGSARQKNIREMFNKGEDEFRARREEKRIKNESMAFELKYELIDKNQKVIDMVNELRAEGQNVGDDANPQYWLEGNNYIGGRVKDFLQVKIDPIKSRLENAGLSWEDLGEALFLERIAKERGAVENPADTLRHELGDALWEEISKKLPDDIRSKSTSEQMSIMKKELSDVPHADEANMFEYVSKQLPESIANPLGYDRKTAEKQLEWFKNQLGEEKLKILERELKTYREVMDEVLDEAIEAELYKPDLIKKMKANPAYATFQVIDYIDTYIPSTIKHQVGTLKGVANPATSTVLKTISTIRAIEKNKTSQTLVDFIKENFPEEIEPAKTRWTGKTHIPVEPKEDGKGLLTVVEEGKYTGYVVDEYIAKTMEYGNIGQAKGVMKGLKFVGRYWFRPVFTTFNLGFQTFNLVRDFFRYWKNIPGMTLPKAIKRYKEAANPAWRRAWDIKDETISEMRQKKLLGLTYYDLIKGQTDTDTQIESELRKFGVKEGKAKQDYFAPARKLFGAIGRFGDFIESVPKVAGYQELNGKLPDQKLGHVIRTQVGSPDFLRKGAGYGWYNEVFLFGNAIKEGVRADLEVATDPQTRSGFWIKTVKASILPKVIMYSILAGVFGDDLEEMMKGVSEYDRTNYTIIPLGMKNGKTVYLRVPQDETGRLIGGLFWKMLRMKDTEQGIARDLRDVFSYAGGQLPGLNPTLTFLMSTMQFLVGKNPYDYFRGRPVIPETEFKAGGKYALKPFLTWQFKQLGGGILWRGYVSQQAPETKSWIQKVVEAPILSNIIGRWVKVSDYGKLERARESQEIIERESARESLEEEKIVEDYVKLFLDGEQTDMRQKRIERKMLEEAIPGFPKIGDDSDKRRKANRIIKDYRQGILYKTTDDQRVRRIMGLYRNDAKVEELLRMRENTDLKDFQNLVEKLKFEKVISDPVIEELNKRSSAKPSNELVFRLVKPAHAAEMPHNAEQNTYDLVTDGRKKGGIAHLIKEKLSGFFKSLNVLKSKDEIVSPLVEAAIAGERIKEPDPEEFKKSALPSNNKPQDEVVIEYKEKLDMPDKYAASVEKWSDKYDVDPKFVMGSMRQESGGAGYKTDLEGSSGEIGLMQVLPDMWEQFDKDKLTDYDYNIMAGVRILKRRLWEAKQIGFENDYGLALAMYNAGYNPENGREYAKIVFGHLEIDESESRWLSEEEGRGFTTEEEEILGIR